jgi:hypothetical protein
VKGESVWKEEMDHLAAGVTLSNNSDRYRRYFKDDGSTKPVKELLPKKSKMVKTMEQPTSAAVRYA